MELRKTKSEFNDALSNLDLELERFRRKIEKKKEHFEEVHDKFMGKLEEFVNQVSKDYDVEFSVDELSDSIVGYKDIGDKQFGIKITYYIHYSTDETEKFYDDEDDEYYNWSYIYINMYFSIHNKSKRLISDYDRYNYDIRYRYKISNDGTTDTTTRDSHSNLTIDPFHIIRTEYSLKYDRQKIIDNYYDIIRQIYVTEVVREYTYKNILNNTYFASHQIIDELEEHFDDDSWSYQCNIEECEEDKDCEMEFKINQKRLANLTAHIIQKLSDTVLGKDLLAQPKLLSQVADKACRLGCHEDQIIITQAISGWCAPGTDAWNDKWLL